MFFFSHEQGGARTFKETLIVRYLCKVSPEVNRALILQLNCGDNLNEVFFLFIAPINTL